MQVHILELLFEESQIHSVDLLNLVQFVELIARRQQKCFESRDIQFQPEHEDVQDYQNFVAFITYLESSIRVRCQWCMATAVRWQMFASYQSNVNVVEV